MMSRTSGVMILRRPCRRTTVSRSLRRDSREYLQQQHVDRADRALLYREVKLPTAQTVTQRNHSALRPLVLAAGWLCGMLLLCRRVRL